MARRQARMCQVEARLKPNGHWHFLIGTRGSERSCQTFVFGFRYGAGRKCPEVRIVTFPGREVVEVFHAKTGIVGPANSGAAFKSPPPSTDADSKCDIKKSPNSENTR